MVVLGAGCWVPPQNLSWNMLFEDIFEVIEDPDEDKKFDRGAKDSKVIICL